MSDRNTTPKQRSVQSVDRVLDIMEALADTPRGLCLSDVATKSVLHASTAHRLLQVLIQRGYVSKDTETNRYRLTMRMFTLGSCVVGGMNILSVARPYLEHLSDLTSEAVHLVVRDNDEVVYLHKEDATSSAIRMASQVGLRNPMYCTGVGKAILAALDDEEINAIWGRNYATKFTKNTIVELDQLHQEIERIRFHGYAIDNEEHERGISCLAAAIKDIQERPIAALSISAPTARLSPKNIELYAPHIIRTAKEIATLIGGARIVLD